MTAFRNSPVGLKHPAPARWDSTPYLLFFALFTSFSLRAETFRLPTSNRAIFEKGGEEKFFVGTTGKPWTSGTFGCVRSGGFQMHEGLDIRCLQRDKRGEPIDSVAATADGTVAYINAKPSLSNYGNYILLRHKIDGLEIISLYAHLSKIRDGLKRGQTIKAGEVIGTMGRTSNTHEGISKERAHVHFELDVFVNDRFSAWYKKTSPGSLNDHGDWNGHNLIAIDPQKILREQNRLGEKFSLLALLRNEKELCRVLVRDTNFPWLKRYPQLIRANPKAEKEGAVGYEVAVDFNGFAFEWIPRAASEIKSKSKIQLLSVNDADEKKNPARKFVVQRKGRWELSARGLALFDLLTF